MPYCFLIHYLSSRREICIATSKMHIVNPHRRAGEILSGGISLGWTLMSLPERPLSGDPEPENKSMGVGNWQPSEEGNVLSRKEAETVLLKAEKLESARRMAASLAHEINNPLTAIMNSLFLVLRIRRYRSPRDKM